MNNRVVRILLAVAALGAARCVLAQDVKVQPVLNKELTGITGKEGTMITVEYAPGASSDPHRHNAHVFVYVIEGSVEMGVNNSPPVTLGPGQSFYESPTDIHTVSRNASKTQPAKFVVFLVAEKGAPRTVPVK